MGGGNLHRHEVIWGLGSRWLQVLLHLQEGLWGSGKRLLQIGLKRLSGIDRTRCVILAGIEHGSWDLYSMIKRLFNPSITLDFLIGHAFCDYPLLSNAPAGDVEHCVSKRHPAARA